MPKVIIQSQRASWTHADASSRSDALFVYLLLSFRNPLRALSHACILELDFSTSNAHRSNAPNSLQYLPVGKIVSKRGLVIFSFPIYFMCISWFKKHSPESSNRNLDKRGKFNERIELNAILFLASLNLLEMGQHVIKTHLL